MSKLEAYIQKHIDDWLANQKESLVGKIAIGRNAADVENRIKDKITQWGSVPTMYYLPEDSPPVKPKSTINYIIHIYGSMVGYARTKLTCNSVTYHFTEDNARMAFKDSLPNGHYEVYYKHLLILKIQPANEYIHHNERCAI